MTDEELKIQAMIRFWKELNSSEQQLKMCEGCQIRWERDTAMEQLAEYHIPFLCVAPDVVEVVRCKDCKHGRLFDTNCVDCEYRELATDVDWYCADGERRSK